MVSMDKKRQKRMLQVGKSVMQGTSGHRRTFQALLDLLYFLQQLVACYCFISQPLQHQQQ